MQVVIAKCRFVQTNISKDWNIFTHCCLNWNILVERIFQRDGQQTICCVTEKEIWIWNTFCYCASMSRQTWTLDSSKRVQLVNLIYDEVVTIDNKILLLFPIADLLIDKETQQAARGEAERFTECRPKRNERARKACCHHLILSNVYR